MRNLLFITSLLILLCFIFQLSPFFSREKAISGAPPYHVADELPQLEDMRGYDEYQNWKRPEGPPKIALQVGHWRNEEVPEELHRLRGNTGAVGGGKTESEVNYTIAMLTKERLEKKGIVVEIFPATVPVDHWADVFVAIHADGNEDPGKSGYKAAVPRRDLTGKAQLLLESVEQAYEDATGLVYDPNVTRNMRGYYAFSWWRYDHAVHPMTTSLILETGFLTSPSDRQIIVEEPERSADGIANGITNYLIQQNLIKQ